HPSMPELPKHTGKVLHDASIVTVTFAGDTYASNLESFGDAIGQTEWWKAVNDEYGVGPATGGGHVSIVDPAPDQITDTEIRKWTADKVTDGTLPVPTDQTIFALYYPSTTTITLDIGGSGTSCFDFGAYHYFAPVTTADGKINVPYAVMPRCPGGLDTLT